MDLHSLQAFVEVARHGSFSAAAEALFVTQPAISKRVKALEEELATALFDRIGRKTSLTEAGRVLLPRAKQLLDEAEDMRRFASSLSDSVSGSLVMGTSHHIGLHRLPPVLSQFSQRYPGVHMDIDFMDSEQACERVLRGEIELAIVTLPDAVAQGLCVDIDAVREAMGDEELYRQEFLCEFLDEATAFLTWAQIDACADESLACANSLDDLAGGQVQQRNFDDYPLLRLEECPEIDVHIIGSEQAPGGVGEPGVPPTAPAVANAVLALTGKPVRRLPIRLARMSYQGLDS
mgnify:CR=1 FL=1